MTRFKHQGISAAQAVPDLIERIDALTLATTAGSFWHANDQLLPRRG